MKRSLMQASLALCVLLCTSSTAFAGINLRVTWVGSTSSIPTLGAWQLAALALLLAVVGIRILRSNAGAARFMSVVLMAGAAGLFLQSARVSAGALGVIIPVSGSECRGGEDTYVFDVDDARLVNNCPNSLEIVSYDLLGALTEDCPVEQQTCPVGTVIAPGDSCQLNYYDLGSCEE